MEIHDVSVYCVPDLFYSIKELDMFEQIEDKSIFKFKNTDYYLAIIDKYIVWFKTEDGHIVLSGFLPGSSNIKVKVVSFQEVFLNVPDEARVDLAFNLALLKNKEIVDDDASLLYSFK